MGTVEPAPSTVGTTFVLADDSGNYAYGLVCVPSNRLEVDRIVRLTTDDLGEYMRHENYFPIQYM